VSYP
jgi:hypothetical protein